MFESFFPKPKLFFSSLAGWVALLIILWYWNGDTVGTFLGFNLEECQTNYIPPIDDDNHVDGNSYELEEK